MMLGIPALLLFFPLTYLHGLLTYICEQLHCSGTSLRGFNPLQCTINLILYGFEDEGARKREFVRMS
jgi:hypothetical protein